MKYTWFHGATGSGYMNNGICIGIYSESRTECNKNIAHSEERAMQLGGKQIIYLEVTRMPLSDLQDETNDFVNKFPRLVRNCCTFISNWDATKIKEKTHQRYSKKVLAKEVLKQYAE
eukprot:9466269-Ditylum_brightwellii.AAC.1